MQIVLLGATNKNLGSTRIWIYDLFDYWKNLNINVTLNDWDNFDRYDVAIFDKNLEPEIVISTKNNYKKLLCGIINPSDYTSIRKKLLQLSDFYIVGSTEEKVYYQQYNKNVFIMPLIERIYTKRKKHTNTTPIIIGYHGNLDHLHAFKPNIKKALENLSEEIPIKLNVIYNKKQLGKWIHGRPNIDIEEIQWDLNSVEKELLKCDIGIVPGLTSISKYEVSMFFRILKMIGKNRGGYDTDYLLRFKNNSNAGRAFVFIQLGIPIVSDFIPSCFDVLSRPDCGYLAYNEKSWFISLMELCQCAKRRENIANNAMHEFNKLYNPLEWSKLLYSNIDNLCCRFDK